MATHSSILAWEIPWTEEPGGLRACNSVCLQCGRPGFDPWVGKIPWRRKWQPTPVLLPGKFHGPRSLVGYSPWGHKQLDTPERLHFHFLTLALFNCVDLSIIVCLSKQIEGRVRQREEGGETCQKEMSKECKCFHTIS